jgi:hypothetical protein
MPLVSDQSPDLPEDVDPRLWIRTGGCTEQDFVWGNAHTFPGRMEAYCPHQRRDFSVSKNEVTDASPEAGLWMDGFLRGHEPEPPQDKGLLPVWRTAIKIFHRSGVWEQPE